MPQHGRNRPFVALSHPIAMPLRLDLAPPSAIALTILKLADYANPRHT